MLDRAGDAVGDVELRRDRLAGLADLVGVRVPARVHRGARGADGGTERVGERLDDREVLGAVDAAAAGDHDRGLGQLGASGGLARGAGDDLGAGGQLAEGDRELLDRTGRGRGLDGRGVGLHRDDRDAAADPGLGGERGGERRLRGDRAVVAGLQVDGVGDDAGAQAQRQAGRDLLALGGGRHQYGDGSTALAAASSASTLGTTR